MALNCVPISTVTVQTSQLSRYSWQIFRIIIKERRQHFKNRMIFYDQTDQPELESVPTPAVVTTAAEEVDR